MIGLPVGIGGVAYQKKCVYTLDCSWTSISYSERETKVLRNDLVTYHFESVKFLLDLLGEHGREAIASCNFAPSVILTAWPSIMELNAWAEANITSSNAAWGPRQAFRFSACKSSKRHEIVFTLNSNGVCSTVS